MKFHWRLGGIVFVAIVVISFPARASPPATQDSALEFAKDHKSTLKSPGAINDRLFQPALSTEREFETFDGSARFRANLMCSSEAPVVRVTAYPVGSLTAIGELNLRIEYDRDLDGRLEGVLTVNNVAGMCGNGIIRDCSPSGSWLNCRYCRWSLEGGAIREQCDYGGAEGGQAPIGPQGMRGCFCFNASCGAPVMSMLETVLSFAAGGIIDQLRALHPALAINKTDFKPESMQLSYLGTKMSNCSEVDGDAKLADLTDLYGKFDFPTDDVIKNTQADPAHPYNSIAQHFGDDGSTYQKCVMQAKVGVETKEAERSSKLDFGIGVDADGGSQQCFWARGGYCGSVFGETGNLSECIDRIVPAGLSDICNQLLVNGGTFTSITGISDYHATSGIGNYFDCYGADNDAADQLWEMTCSGMRRDDVFVCKSPSMSLPGKTIRNAPYNQALYQGCEEVREPENSCAALEKRRVDGECQLQTELADGVYTVRDGAGTGLEPAQSCKTFSGGLRSIQVCEPWWRRERVYRCKADEPDFSKIKERAVHVGNTIDYDFDNNIWKHQGDLTWQGEEKTTRVFDPNLEFMPAAESCLPGCRVRKSAKTTDVYVPGQGKLAADGNYHMEADGRLSTTLNKDTVVEYIKECEERDKTWTCPLEEGESMVAGCQCFDKESFGQVVGTLQAINMASTNMICSSGENVGVCTPENQGVETKRVVCGDFSMSPSGEVQIEPSGILDCQPKLWRGLEVSPQTHRVETTDAYECKAFVPGYPEDDHFDNHLGPLVPLSAWFDIPVQEAGPRIIDVLKSDPRFIPDPGPECPCGAKTSSIPGSGGALTTQTGATTCTWTVETSVANINREDKLGLRPTDRDPFGDAYLYFSRIGSWGGSTSGTCTQSPAPGEITTAAQECVWIRNREDCAQGGWISYRGAFDVKPQGSGTATYYVGAVPLSATDRGIDLHVWYQEHDHLGTVQLLVYSDGCPGGAYVPGTAWSFTLPDGNTASTTREGAVPAQCLNGSALQVYVHSEGGRGYSGRHLWVDQIYYRSLSCTQTAQYGCLAQTATMPSNCVVDGTITNCAESGIAGPYTANLSNIIAYITRQIPLYSQGLPAGAGNLSVRTNFDATCLRGNAAIEYQTGACPGWRQGYATAIDCTYHENLGGGVHVCPFNNTFKIPDSCLSGTLELRLSMNGARTDSRCTGSLRTSVQYQHETCTTEPRYVCDDQAACSAGCGVVRKYACANGPIVSEPALCPRWVCSKMPGASFQTQADCTAACAEPVACNAQSDDFRFKVTIRNNSNDYLSILDVVSPDAVHIDSWLYPYEDRILQQCVDRYTQPYLAFTDPATSGKFAYAPMDALIYQWSAERGEAARDASSGTPHSLPKYPPVYRPRTDGGKTTVPNTPMYWDKRVSGVWTDDDSLRLGYFTLQAGGLLPYVYYYQCPTGEIRPGTANTCGAVPPFGGVDWTVQGPACFERRCDPDAVIEPDQNLGNCGMVNDGDWQ